MARLRERPGRVAILLLVLACDPYQRFGEGTDSYGPVDPINFPPANLGVRGEFSVSTHDCFCRTADLFRILRAAARSAAQERYR